MRAPVWLAVEASVGERTRASSLLEGASATAPTAPHATPPRAEADETTGPARFWSARRVKQGLAIGFGLSVIFHWLISPFAVLPQGPSIELHDQAGDLSIPVDFIGEGPNDNPGKTSTDPTGHGGTGTAAGAGDAAIDAP